MTDFTKPFFLSKTNIRGRFAQCDDILKTIFSKKAYPQAIENLVAEAVTLTALLASTLKFDGIFTLQVKGDGPVSLLVVDATNKGEIRACATYDEKRFQDLLKDHKEPHLLHLMGKGFLTFTTHHGNQSDNYQGVVELDNESLAKCAHHYFKQSEQMNAYVHINAEKNDDNTWFARGMFLQQLPFEPEKNTFSKQEFEDNWREVVIYMGSLKKPEFLDKNLTALDLIKRLFHEFDTMVYTENPLTFKCRCSEERAKSIVELVPDDEREHADHKGKAVIICEFCGQDYVFDLKDLKPFEK